MGRNLKAPYWPLTRLSAPTALERNLRQHSLAVRCVPKPFATLSKGHPVKNHLCGSVTFSQSMTRWAKSLVKRTLNSPPSLGIGISTVSFPWTNIYQVPLGQLTHRDFIGVSVYRWTNKSKPYLLWSSICTSSCSTFLRPFCEAFLCLTCEVMCETTPTLGPWGDLTCGHSGAWHLPAIFWSAHMELVSHGRPLCQ